MPVNSVLCHLLSWVNKAERWGEMWDNCKPSPTVGLSVCLWVVLRTFTVLHPRFSSLSLSLSFASQMLSFFSYSAFISPLPPRQLAEPAWHQGCPDFCLPHRGFIASPCRLAF